MKWRVALRCQMLLRVMLNMLMLVLMIVGLVSSMPSGSYRCRRGCVNGLRCKLSRGHDDEEKGEAILVSLLIFLRLCRPYVESALRHGEHGTRAVSVYVRDKAVIGDGYGNPRNGARRMNLLLTELTETARSRESSLSYPPMLSYVRRCCVVSVTADQSGFVRAFDAYKR